MVIKLKDNAICSREWTGNDRVNHNHFGRIRINESPLKIRLFWKMDDNSPRELIGCYKLDLIKLLNEGYIREIDNSPGEVILRFQRTNIGRIQISVNKSSPALTIGTFSGA